jgi:hypothetical protein
VTGIASTLSIASAYHFFQASNTCRSVASAAAGSPAASILGLARQRRVERRRPRHDWQRLPAPCRAPQRRQRQDGNADDKTGATDPTSA